MTIQWNGHDVGLAPGMADAIEAVVGPLPYLYVVDSGLRTYQQQAADYAKGRDAAGNIVNLQAVVTYAKPGASAHNAGLAVDLYPVVNGSLDYGYSRGMPEPSPQALPSWQALWDAVDASRYLHSGRNIVSSTGQRLYDPGHIERVNWRLFVGSPVPAEATSTAQGGSAAPTSGDSPVPDGGPSSPSPLGDALAQVQQFFELDPGVTIGLAALLGTLLLVWLARRQ